MALTTICHAAAHLPERNVVPADDAADLAERAARYDALIFALVAALPLLTDEQRAVVIG